LYLDQQRFIEIIPHYVRLEEIREPQANGFTITTIITVTIGYKQLWDVKLE
jgi:hypothetical protein